MNPPPQKVEASYGTQVGGQGQRDSERGQRHKLFLSKGNLGIMKKNKTEK